MYKKLNNTFKIQCSKIYFQFLSQSGMWQNPRDQIFLCWELPLNEIFYGIWPGVRALLDTYMRKLNSPQSGMGS
jgi:hypothetical protein